MTEIGYPSPGRSILWCDNITAVALAANPMFHACTKHIEIDVHFIRDHVLNGTLEVRYVPSTDQLADCLTKPLSHTQFADLRSNLGVTRLPTCLKRDVREMKSRPSVLGK